MMTLEHFAREALKRPTPFVDGGRDFDGWDCWGMAVIAYRECLGIDLTSYDDISALDRKAISAQAETEASKWKLLSWGEERPGDGLLFRECHVALVIRPGRMLHVGPGTDTCLVDYRTTAWKNRIVGAYRYAGG